MSLTLPLPPNPDELQYKSNPLAYNRAIYNWALQSKGKLEQSQSISDGIPIAGAQIGDMPYKGSAAWMRLAGSSAVAGQILGYGTSSAPVWGNISSNIVAGSNVSVTGTGTATLALANIAPKNLLANTGTAIAAPSASTLTALIDSAIAAVQGDILYRGTAAWQALAPGASGQFLQTNGTSANPQWAGFSPITNSLGTDVALNNTGSYFDGPSIAQGTSGTWFTSGSVTVSDTAGASAFNAKLWDGATVIASGQIITPAANSTETIALSGFITSPAGNLRISVNDQLTTGKIKFNASANSKDSTLTAIRIG